MKSMGPKICATEAGIVIKRGIVLSTLGPFNWRKQHKDNSGSPAKDSD